MKIGTFIYSSNSVEKLKEMLNEFFLTFNIPAVTPDDLFYYSVFCKDITYANYKFWDEAPADLDIPDILTSVCSTAKDRLDYVHEIIGLVTKGEIEKPEWMIHVEMEETCNDYETPPSNFLYLIPKKDKYRRLAEKILEFLYSPNLIDFTVIT